MPQSHFHKAILAVGVDLCYLWLSWRCFKALKRLFVFRFSFGQRHLIQYEREKRISTSDVHSYREPPQIIGRIRQL